MRGPSAKAVEEPDELGHGGHLDVHRQHGPNGGADDQTNHDVPIALSADYCHHHGQQHAQRAKDIAPHSRAGMSHLLQTKDEQSWLNKDTSRKDRDSLLVPFDSSKMVAHSISRLITTRYEDTNTPEVQKPHNYEELSGT